MLHRVYNNHIFLDHDDERLGRNSSIDWDAAPGYNATGSSALLSMMLGGPEQFNNSFHTGPTCRNTSLGMSCHTQSLPDFDNPCQRIWQRYFADNASINTWFTGNHSVSWEQFGVDCNKTVSRWRAGVKQIRCAMTNREVCATQRLNNHGMSPPAAGRPDKASLAFAH